MLIALSAVLPIMMLIATGLIVVKLDWVSEQFPQVLNRYVMQIAAPALLFRNTALTPFPDEPPWGLWLGYYGSMLPIFFLGYALARLSGRGYSHQEGFVIGFGSTFSNTIMLGIPVILTAFGPKAELPLYLILAFHGLYFLTFMTLCMELSQPRGLDWSKLWRAILSALARQNVLVAIIAGVTYGAVGFTFAPFVDRFLSLLGESTIPVALVMTGAILARVRVRSAINIALCVAGLKIIAQPLLTYCVGRYLLGLPELWVAVMTVLAAMPSGLFTNIFAESYQAASEEASSLIVLSTSASAVTLTIILSLFAEFLV